MPHSPKRQNTTDTCTPPSSLAAAGMTAIADASDSHTLFLFMTKATYEQQLNSTAPVISHPGVRFDSLYTYDDIDKFNTLNQTPPPGVNVTGIPHIMIMVPETLSDSSALNGMLDTARQHQGGKTILGIVATEYEINNSFVADLARAGSAPAAARG